MEKETLTLESIQKDLKKAIVTNTFSKTEQHDYCIPVTAMAIIIGILLQNVWIGLAIFSFAVYPIVMIIRESRLQKKKATKLTELSERGDISISVETLSHITEETVMKANQPGKSIRLESTTVFYFTSGISWSATGGQSKNKKLYSWSRTHYLSTIGLKNLSVEGNEFYYVALQGHSDIAYIYPCKLFKLDPSLLIKS
jgi:hypothetical protein